MAVMSTRLQRARTFADALYGHDQDGATEHSADAGTEFMYEPLARHPTTPPNHDVGFAPATREKRDASAGLTLQFLDDDAQYDTD